MAEKEKNPFKHDSKTRFAKAEELDKKKVREQAEQLREALEYHNYRYYIKNDPEISDSRYDKLFRRLPAVVIDGQLYPVPLLQADCMEHDVGYFSVICIVHFFMSSRDGHYNIP